MRNKNPNKRILILCEGVTEYLYAKSLQQELPRTLQRSVSVEIDYNSNNDPKSLAHEALKKKRKAKKERNPYDFIWLFFDNDNWPQLNNAFEIIDKENLLVAYSSMCIEHWFILHFEDCGKSFVNGPEALKHLKTKWPEYHKTKLKHYQHLKPNLEDALSRADILNKNSDPDLPVFQKNPFFTIGNLITFFEDIKKP